MGQAKIIKKSLAKNQKQQLEHAKVVKVGLLWFFSQQDERQIMAIIIKASFAYCGTLKLFSFFEVAKTFYSQTMMSFGSAGFGWMAFLRLCVCASRLRHGHRHTAFTDEFWVTWWQQPPSPHSLVSHPTLEENVSSSSVTCTCANGRASVWAFQPRTMSMSAPLQPLRRHTGNRMVAFIWCGQIIFKSIKQ